VSRLRALFDVNFLIALLDSEHVGHNSARSWWKQNRDLGWASCPISQNGYLRITTQPRYPTPQTMAEALETLQFATQSDEHEFWPDDLSLADATKVNRVWSSVLTN
jgi:toxin-antitoxin system PIN domain toxin